MDLILLMQDTVQYWYLNVLKKKIEIEIQDNLTGGNFNHLRQQSPRSTCQFRNKKNQINLK